VAKRPFYRKECFDYQALWNGMAQNLGYLKLSLEMAQVDLT
jgi:hypothetical protein